MAPVIFTPCRVRQDSVILSPSRVSLLSALRKLGILQQISTFPSNIHTFLTSIPGSLGLKIVPRRHTNIQRNHFPSISKLPQESPIQFPQESWNSSPQAVSLSPVDSGSLSSQSTNASPGFIQRVISLPGYNWVILSQKPRKGRRQHSSFLSPAKSINTSNTTRVSPASYYQHSAKYLSPHRVLLPSKIIRVLFSPQSNPFAKFIPQRSHLLLPVFLQLSSPAEAKSILQHQPRIRLPGTRQGFIFLDENTFINITSSYIIACIYASYLTNLIYVENIIA